MGGVKCDTMAGRFCRLFSEVCALLRSQSHRNHSHSLPQRRAIDQERFAQLMSLMVAAQPHAEGFHIQSYQWASVLTKPLKTQKGPVVPSRYFFLAMRHSTAVGIEGAQHHLHPDPLQRCAQGPGDLLGNPQQHAENIRRRKGCWHGVDRYWLTWMISLR